MSNIWQPMICHYRLFGFWSITMYWYDDNYFWIQTQSSKYKIASWCNRNTFFQTDQISQSSFVVKFMGSASSFGSAFGNAGGRLLFRERIWERRGRLLRECIWERLLLLRELFGSIGRALWSAQLPRERHHYYQLWEPHNHRRTVTE